MGGLAVDPLFTNIPLKEIIRICTESIYDQNDSTESLNKFEFKEILSLATKESYFIFNEILCKRIVQICGHHFDPLLLMLSFVFYKKKWLQQCPDKVNPVYYRRYVDDIFVLFKSCNYLIKFRDYLNKCHPNKNFSLEEEKNGKLSFFICRSVSRRKQVCHYCLLQTNF